MNNNADNWWDSYNNTTDDYLSPRDEEEVMLPIKDLGTPVLRQHVRKLRHVVGVTLRNLTLKSPGYAKRRASLVKWQQNSRTVNELDEDWDKVTTHHQPDEENTVNNNSESPRRAMRRRTSTLSQHSTTMGVEIEQTLQDLNQDQLLDSMFAIYTNSQSPPVYISEMAHRSMNPEFLEMDFGQLYCRDNNQLSVHVYAKVCSSTKWRLLMKHTIQLETLKFIGKSIDVLRIGFPKNTLILHLQDGCYVLPSATGVPSNVDIDTKKFGSSVGTLSCSFDMIMKLNNLEDCVIDSDSTIKTVDKQAKELINDECLFVKKKTKSQLENQLVHTNQHVLNEKSKIRQLQKQVVEIKTKLAQRRQVMKDQQQEITNLNQQMSKLNTTNLEVQEQLIAVEQGRIATQLQQIFPIEPIPNKSLIFSICGLELPGADLTNITDEDQVGAAYGFVAQLVHLLSQYLCVPLRYPIQPYGSNSFIIDPISTIQGSRTFPLWSKGSLYYRFDYGVFLFHKDIEQLINARNLAMTDLSHTLANLKNLLLVLSSVKA